MRRRTALVAAVMAILGIVACVSDDPIDPNAKTDAGTATDSGTDAQASSSGTTSSSGATSSGSGDTGANRAGLLCGSLLANSFPSCPGVGVSDDVCKDLTPACCPGNACAALETPCPAPASSKSFSCFTGAHCNEGSESFTNFCCVSGTDSVLDKDTQKQNGCGEPNRLTLSATANTECRASCSGYQLCKPGDPSEKCNTGSCQETIIIVPNPKGEAFIRKTGVCR